jgi:uncharacterized circularly permuted ATP-grasp superfamily protein
MSSPASADPAHFDNLKQLPHFQTYTLGAAYDEMLDPRGVAREQYAVLLDRLQSVGPLELRQRQSPPTRGVFKGRSSSTLSVSVEITPGDTLPTIDPAVMQVTWTRAQESLPAIEQGRRMQQQ